MNEREILLRLIASMGLCETLGDVAEDVNAALKELGHKSISLYPMEFTALRKSMEGAGIFLGTMHCSPEDLDE